MCHLLCGHAEDLPMICLGVDVDDKTDKTKKVSKSSSLSWGTNKNRQKSASTLCSPSVGVAMPPVKKSSPLPSAFSTPIALCTDYKRERSILIDLQCLCHRGSFSICSNPIFSEHKHTIDMSLSNKKPLEACEDKLN